MALAIYEPTTEQYLADIRKHAVRPNYVDSNGVPALCVAIYKHRSISLVEALLREGADVNLHNSSKAHCIYQGFPQGKLYRRYGRKLAPLHIALATQQFGIARLLLDNGADPNAKTSNDIEPLSLIFNCDYKLPASNGNDLEVVKLMVQRGARIHVRDYQQKSLLHRAIIAGKQDVARYLISSGCDVNDVDEDGETPLHLAEGDIECAKLLLENCANPNSQNREGNTVYHQVMTPWEDENIKMKLIQLLHEHQVDPNIRNNNGMTPLHECLRSLNLTADIVECILENGADTKVKDNLGKTPAFYLGSSYFNSTFLGNLSASNLDKLLNCGINGVRDLNGEPLIHTLATLCCEHKDPLSFERIISCIAQAHPTDVNIRDNQNRTALHLISAKGNWELAEVLLRHGGDINAKDDDCNTPLHLAVQRKCWKLASKLLQWETPKTEKGFLTAKPYLRSKSVPNLAWTPKCLSSFEIIFSLEDNYSSFPRITQPILLSNVDVYTKYFPAPSLSKVIGRRIDATSLLQTCEEYCLGDFHVEENCDEEKCLIAKEVRRLITELVVKCEELDPRLKSNLLLTGSVVEGTKMWLPDEFDFMMELTEFKDCCDLGNKEGFDSEVTVRKMCRSCWSDLFEKEDNFQLSPEKLKKHVESLLQTAVLSLDRNAYPKLWFNFCEYHSKADFLQTTKVGVKLSFFWYGEKYKKLPISVDLTPAIPLLEQYEKQLHERVNSMGCGSYFHVIPYVDRNDHHRVIWRVSFSLAELELIRGMSSKQVSLYKCLKLLRDIHVLNATEVPSYPLKCCIFEFVFGDGYIDNASFIANVKELLRQLTVYAEAEYFSSRVLEHFFLKYCPLDLTIYDMRWCLTALDFLG